MTICNGMAATQVVMVGKSERRVAPSSGLVGKFIDADIVVEFVVLAVENSDK